MLGIYVTDEHTPSVIAESAATAAKNSAVVTLSVRLAPVALAVTACAALATARSPAPTTASLPETMLCHDRHHDTDIS